jgi:hypothetical protein
LDVEAIVSDIDKLKIRLFDDPILYYKKDERGYPIKEE